MKPGYARIVCIFDGQCASRSGHYNCGVLAIMSNNASVTCCVLAGEQQCLAEIPDDHEQSDAGWWPADSRRRMLARRFLVGEQCGPGGVPRDDEQSVAVPADVGRFSRTEWCQGKSRLIPCMRTRRSRVERRIAGCQMLNELGGASIL